MDGEQKKPVTGSNEHHAEIDSRLGALESKTCGLEGTQGTQSTLISNLQSELSALKSRIQSLERVNPAG